jgi:hypothetical protein
MRNYTITIDDAFALWKFGWAGIGEENCTFEYYIDLLKKDGWRIY